MAGLSAQDGALRAARARVHVGAIVSTDPGRTDTHKIDVHDGSFVLPADCVSALGENNTLAGMRKLNRIFGQPDEQGRPSGHGVGKVPIIAAGGEYVIHPEAVLKVGGGDIKHGHEILDAFVKEIRARHIKTLKGLPATAKD